MEEQKEDKEFLEPLLERVREYGTTSYELFRLKTIQKATEVASTVYAGFVVAIAFSVFFLFTNLGLAIWLGDLLGEPYYGFLCIAGIYFVVWAILLACKKIIKKRVGNTIIAKLTHAH